MNYFLKLDIIQRKTILLQFKNIILRRLTLLKYIIMLGIYTRSIAMLSVIIN